MAPIHRAEHVFNPRSESGRESRAAVFAPMGEYWTIGYTGAVFSIKDSKGLTYLNRLLQHPGEEFHVLDLTTGSVAPEDPQLQRSSIDTTLSIGGLGDSGTMLDTQAKRDYQHRVIELRQELEDATEIGNLERAAQIESEIKFIAREISRAVGLGGRDRRAGSAAERARLNVARAIKRRCKRFPNMMPRWRSCWTALFAGIARSTFCRPGR